VADAVDTVVVGGGQAGLSASYHLSRHGREHVVLEQGRVGETWRTGRWDGFRLNTPNLFLQLPGHAYDGDDPEGFLTRDETVAYLERYADAAEAPLVTGVRVSSARRRPGGGFVLETSNGTLETANLVVATGAFQQPALPAVSGDVPAGVLQLHSGRYVRPEQLPPGAVLVVGSGQSGCQIANELNRSGRRVFLSVGRCPSVPLHYRRRQFGVWAVELGLMDDTVESLPSPSARLAGNPTVSSDEVDHLCGPRRLARQGVVLAGRLVALDGPKAIFRPDLDERLAESDEFVARFRQRVDDYVRAAGLDVPEEADPPPEPIDATRVGELDLRAAGVETIVWANGYRPDFGWIEPRIVDTEGWPIQTRGVTSVPGLYFVGLHWLSKRKSALLLGVGEDAEHVVSALVGASRSGRLAHA
jgi:putative flavoprotein involved in K+ transport